MSYYLQARSVNEEWLTGQRLPDNEAERQRIIDRWQTVIDSTEYPSVEVRIIKIGS
jgi:hypothetical protein